MNDALYEQLVPRKQKTSGILISILIIVLAVAVAVLGMPLVGFLSFLIAVLILMIAFYFIFPKLNVEYEYMILNHDLQIEPFTTSPKENICSVLIFSLPRSLLRKNLRG